MNGFVNPYWLMSWGILGFERVNTFPDLASALTEHKRVSRFSKRLHSHYPGIPSALKEYFVVDIRHDRRAGVEHAAKWMLNKIEEFLNDV